MLWLLSKLSPDHKTISEFRKNNAKSLKNVFHSFVKLCLKQNLYGKELVAIDGSKFHAVNSLDNNFSQEKLSDRIKRIDKKIEEYLEDLNQNDKAEAETEADTPNRSEEEIATIISELNSRKEKYQTMKTQLEESGKTQLSTTDPDSRRMKQADGGSDMSYNIQTAVDGKNKLIMDYSVTNNCNDNNLLYPMAESVKEILETEKLGNR